MDEVGCYSSFGGNEGCLLIVRAALKHDRFDRNFQSPPPPCTPKSYRQYAILLTHLDTSCRIRPGTSSDALFDEAEFSIIAAATNDPFFGQIKRQFSRHSHVCKNTEKHECSLLKVSRPRAMQEIIQNGLNERTAEAMKKSNNNKGGFSPW
jgi:hypothetical protein